MIIIPIIIFFLKNIIPITLFSSNYTPNIISSPITPSLSNYTPNIISSPITLFSSNYTPNIISTPIKSIKPKLWISVLPNRSKYSKPPIKSIKPEWNDV